MLNINIFKNSQDLLNKFILKKKFDVEIFKAKTNVKHCSLWFKSLYSKFFLFITKKFIVVNDFSFILTVSYFLF